jgi:Sec-independent protein translocase protein TatA
MSTKELMAIRKLVSQHGIDAEQFVKALKRDSGNPRLIPDPRDKADRTRIFKRGGKLIGKDLMADAPEKMSISVAPDQVALLTADGLRYMQQYSDTEDAYLLLKKTDYNYIQMEIKALNELLNKSKANPDDAELDVEVRKTAFDLSKTVSTRFNRELDVERIINKHGLQYALMWQKQLARPYNDTKMAQNLKQLGVEVKPTESDAPFESLMSKFEGKSLQEQLTILGKLDKQKIDEAYKKITFRENTVPDNRTVTIVNDLLSKHFPASDLNKQMDAFTAIPMPEMIDSFRSIERTQGPDACCRGVLCQFINYLHPTLKDQINSNFCDGKTSDLEKSQCKPCNEAWQGNPKIRKTGKWAGKTIAELQKRANSLRKKETRTDAESSELKQINFAIRSKRDWKGDTKENKHFDEARLNSARTDKYLPIVQQIIDKGDATFNIGEKGDEGIFVADKGQKVVNRLTSLTGTLNGEPAEIKVNQIFKTPKMVAIAQGKDPNAVSASASKESYEIKPSQIFSDETFNATKVFDEVIKNPVLQQSEIGQHIIKMAKEIQNGQQPNMNDTPKEFYTAIRDYAGEYLGVLALIRGTANFPTRDAWLKHLDVRSLDEIVINFPKESNFALGDSIGSFENSKTGNQILISSKGGKKGAPPSLNGLKIPDELKSVPAYANEIDVIEALQGASGIAQPFVGLNKIAEYNPESINKAVRKLLPFTEKDIFSITKLMDGKLYDKSDINKLPAKFKPLLKLINLDRVNPRATPGGIIHYTLNKVLVDAVNNNNAMPNFEPLAREILQKNFIQIFARPKGGVLGFDVLWPSKDLATGKIELYSKASSTEPGKQKMSFSVT